MSPPVSVTNVHFPAKHCACIGRGDVMNPWRAPARRRSGKRARVYVLAHSQTKGGPPGRGRAVMKRQIRMKSSLAARASAALVAADCQCASHKHGSMTRGPAACGTLVAVPTSGANKSTGGIRKVCIPVACIAATSKHSAARRACVRISTTCCVSTWSLPLVGRSPRHVGSVPPRMSSDRCVAMLEQVLKA